MIWSLPYAGALKTPLVLKHASKRPLFDKEKAMNGPSVKPMSPWAAQWEESTCKSAKDAPQKNQGVANSQYGHSISLWREGSHLQSPTPWHPPESWRKVPPTSPSYWHRLQTKALAPCLQHKQWEFWTLLEDDQNTIMSLILTHTSSFYQVAPCPQSKCQKN